MLLGPVIATVLGLIFLELNSGGLPGGWPVVIRMSAAVIAAGLLIAILRAGRHSLAHFLALARVWPIRSFHVLATVMVILGVSGFGATLVGSTRAAGDRSSRVDKR